MWQTLKGTLAQLSGLAPGWALAALLVYAISHLFVSGRWWVVLSGLGKPVPLRETFIANLCSIFVNNVTPGRVGGEIFRVAMLQRRTGVDLALATVAQGYDRLTDLVPLTLMVLLALPTLRRMADRPTPTGGLLLGLVIAGALLVAIVWGVRRAKSLVAGAIGWLQRFSRFRIARRDFLFALLLSITLWALDLVRLMLGARALGVFLDPGQALALSVVALLGGFVPTLGGLGAVEGGLTAALVLFGVPVDKALAIALFERGLTYWLGSAAGGVALLLIGGRRVLRAVRRSVEEQESPTAAAAPLPAPSVPPASAPLPATVAPAPPPPPDDSDGSGPA